MSAPASVDGPSHPVARKGVAGQCRRTGRVAPLILCLRDANVCPEQPLSRRYPDIAANQVLSVAIAMRGYRFARASYNIVELSAQFRS